MPIPMGDLFAPAYNVSDPASVQAVNNWQTRNFPMTNPLVEQTRMAVPGVNTGNPAGMVDVEALRSLSQGGLYDMNARRNSIAASLTPSGGGGGGGGGGGYTPAYLPGGGLDPNDPGNIIRYYQLMGYGVTGAGGGGGAGGGAMSGGPYSSGGPIAPGVMPPQVGLGVS